ncbi:MAG: alginate export family protein [Candidatus Omnitrophica bacterium]|nr:alginate export family protein [Candidatus Omnitrophota bacterium]
MSRRLIMILALAFLVGIVYMAYAEVQDLKVSGDLTALAANRQLSVTDLTTGTDVNKRNPSSFLGSILRLRVDANLTDNVSTSIRLLNERYWDAPDAFNDKSAIVLDLAYAQLKEFLYSPLTLTVGRQELHFGNDMVVGARWTNNAIGATSYGFTSDPDLSVDKAFDAIRATLNYDPLVIDVIAAKIDENTLNKKDDNNLFGVYTTYALNKNIIVEPYWFLRQRQAEDSSVVAQTIGKNDDTHVLGVLVRSTPVENVTVSAEGAVQLGKAARTPNYSSVSGTGTAFSRQAPPREAFAAELGVNLAMPKVKYTPTLTALYAFFEGQHGNDTKKVTQWDPMYENQAYGHIANALFNQTNAHIAGVILTAKPKEDLTLKGEYYAFWWDKVYADGQNIYDLRGDLIKMTNKKFAAQELDLTAIYDYTEDVQFSLLGAILIPGNAFDKSNRKLANEVIGSMKVTF